MSRFDELSRLYAEERHEWWNYRGECAAFARDVRQAIVRDLGFPPDCVCFAHADGADEKPGTRPTAFGVQSFEDDGYCEFPMQLTLHNGNANTFPRCVHRLRLRVQKRGESFFVKLYSEATPIEASRQPGDLKKITDGVFELMRESHNGTLGQYLSGMQPGKSRIGFSFEALVEGSEEADQSVR